MREPMKDPDAFLKEMITHVNNKALTVNECISLLKAHLYIIDKGSPIEDWVELNKDMLLGVIREEVFKQFKKSGVKNVWLEQGDLAQAIAKGETLKWIKP